MNFIIFFRRLEITKKNNNKEILNKDELINQVINDLILDINKYKEKLGFYKHVQLSDNCINKLMQFFDESEHIYRVNYGYLFHFISWYVYRLISFKKMEEINIDPTDSKNRYLTSKIAGGNKIYKFIYYFVEKLIQKQNKNLLDFLKEILPIIFIVSECILKNDNYTFIELIKNEEPDYYVLYKDNNTGLNYIWPIEVGGIYIKYLRVKNNLTIDYQNILRVISKKLKMYSKYEENSYKFISKNSLISKFGDLDNKKLIIKNTLISFFPINKRICKYELLQILEEVKKLCIKNKKEHTNTLNELSNNDYDKEKIRFFCLESFYCDTLIYLLNKKTNFNKTIPAYCIKINFKESPTYKIDDYKDEYLLNIYQNEYSENDKAIIENVIKVLEHDENILEKNEIKNVHCKNDGDIESINLYN